ncbi:MAG: DUF1376 domain-containing protein [Rudaea sp.]|nr:DUF1376 domain-containing protein [Rudaea sp.]
MNMPAPLVPAHIDLRDFQFMPLDVVRLRDSSMALKANGDEFRAAVMLWCVAWHQVPAGSLPNDECDLATYAGYGKRSRLGYDKSGWEKVREGALRGFKLCDDNRIYHSVIAEKAIEAWDGKLKLRHKRECERIKKAAQRAETTPSYPTFDEWKEHLAKTGEDKWVPASQGTCEGQSANVPRESHSLREHKGQGTGDRGQGTALASTLLSVEASTHVATEADAIARACHLMEEASGEHVNPSREDLVLAIREGVTPEALRDTVLEALASKKRKTNPIAWAIATARSRKTATNRTAAPSKSAAPRAAPTPKAIEPKRVRADPTIVGGILTSLKEAMRW